MTKIWVCPKCKETSEANFDSCWNCSAARPGELTPTDEAPQPEQTIELAVPLFTANAVGAEATKSLGIVSGYGLAYWDAADAFLGGISDAFSVDLGEYQAPLEEARIYAMQRAAEKAKSLEADAIVGAQFAFQHLGTYRFLVSCIGTAVQLSEKR